MGAVGVHSEGELRRQDVMSFEQMQAEMSIIDTDGNGTIDWEEFVALMLGKVRGAEKLAAAMRTAFAIGAAAQRTGRRRSTVSNVDPAAIGLGDQDNERLIDPTLPVLRHALAESIADNVAAVVRILAPDGSRFQLDPKGVRGMYAKRGDDAIEEELFGSGEYWDAWQTFYLKSPGDGLFRRPPENDFQKVLRRRFGVMSRRRARASPWPRQAGFGTASARRRREGRYCRQHLPRAPRGQAAAAAGADAARRSDPSVATHRDVARHVDARGQLNKARPEYAAGATKDHWAGVPGHAIGQDGESATPAEQPRGAASQHDPGYIGGRFGAGGGGSRGGGASSGAGGDAGGGGGEADEEPESRWGADDCVEER